MKYVTLSPILFAALLCAGCSSSPRYDADTYEKWKCKIEECAERGDAVEQQALEAWHAAPAQERDAIRHALAWNCRSSEATMAVDEMYRSELRQECLLAEDANDYAHRVLFLGVPWSYSMTVDNAQSVWTVEQLEAERHRRALQRGIRWLEIAHDERLSGEARNGAILALAQTDWFAPVGVPETEIWDAILSIPRSADPDRDQIFVGAVMSFCSYVPARRIPDSVRHELDRIVGMQRTAKLAEEFLESHDDFCGASRFPWIFLR